MWFLVAFLLVLNTDCIFSEIIASDIIIISADNASNPNCDLGNFMYCGVQPDVIAELPENLEEMAKRCLEYSSYLECRIKFNEMCLDDWYPISILKSAQNVLKKTCDPNSELSKVIAENGKCVKSAYFEATFDNTCIRQTRLKNPEKYDAIIYINDFVTEYIPLDFSNDTVQYFEYENASLSTDESDFRFDGVSFNETTENDYFFWNSTMSVDYHQADLEWCLYAIMNKNCIISQLIEDCGKNTAELFATINDEIYSDSEGFDLFSSGCRNHTSEADEFIKDFNMSIYIRWEDKNSVGIREKEDELEE